MSSCAFQVACLRLVADEPLFGILAVPVDWPVLWQNLRTDKIPGSLGATVYRKPTNTGWYLNFHSCHSSATRKEFMKGLFLRVERLCSSPDLLRTEMEVIYAELLSNSYPQRFIVSVAKSDRKPSTFWNIVGRQQSPFLRHKKYQKRYKEGSIRKAGQLVN